MHATLIDTRIDRLSPELLRFLARRCSDPEGTLQEIWLKVVRANPTCADERSFRAYVYAVARRQLIDAHRRQQARVSLVAMDEPAADALSNRSDTLTPHDTARAAGLLDEVERTLAGLNPEIAQVFRWRMTESVSFKDIARRQNVPLNTALGRHHRAVKAIAKALRTAGLGPEETS